MNLQTVKLVKLSICQCGYAVLKDHIKVGAKYDVDMDSIRDGYTYECGGCGKKMSGVRIVGALSNNPMHGLRPLPAGLFGLSHSPRRNHTCLKNPALVDPDELL